MPFTDPASIIPPCDDSAGAGMPSEDRAGQLALKDASPSERFLRLIPRDFARLHLVLSDGADGEVERLVVAPTSNLCAIFNVGVRLGCRVATRTGDPEQIARSIDAVYASWQERGEQDRDGTGDAGEGSGVETSDIDRLLERADRDLLSTQGKGPVVQLVDALLLEALGRGASDVHVQPLSDRAVVRYRTDGVLHTVRHLKPDLAAAVVSRIKVMGRMDIAERRVPQDGRATVTIGKSDESGGGGGGRSVDLRISTLPTAYGERAVIRLLESSRGEFLLGLEALGMPSDVRAAYEGRTNRTSGIVLVTGPTGSGKSTTLYATLLQVAARVDAPASANGPGSSRSLPGGGGGDLNVMTIEDPIEYELSTVGLAVSQAQVNTKKGVTFATGLRHILRQDPDVIMIGEIRDAETARIAIQASLTGHLVLSTLHTNDAATAVTRLVDLGVEPYLVSASLEASLAQRLVRRVHAACRGEGCDGEGGCFGTGLRGRTGLFELLLVDEPIRELITRGASASQIRNAARAAGMRTLGEEGQRLVREGITTAVEAARVVQVETVETIEGKLVAPEATRGGVEA